MKFKLGEICLTQHMPDPNENNLEAEITGVGTIDAYRLYGGVTYENALHGCDYEVHIPKLAHQAPRGLFDIPEANLKKLPDGKLVTEWEECVWTPKKLVLE